MSNRGPTNADILSGVLTLVGTLIAIVGNILVCLTIYRSSRLRTPTNVYIAAMATIGLLFAAFSGPSITVTMFAGRKWIFGQHFCNFQGFMILFIEFATLHTIALTAFNRFCRMSKFHLYQKIFPSKRQSCAIMILVWTIQVAFIFTFSLPSFAKYEFNAKRASCVLKFDGEIAEIIYTIMKSTFYFGITSIIVVYCYAKVFCNIREHTRKVSATFRTGEKINIEEIRITRTVFGVVLFFLVCWIPEYIISIIIRVHPDHLHPVAHRVVVFFLFVSCSSNPWVYAATNREFRNEFKRLLICRGRRNDVVELVKPKKASTEEPGVVELRKTSSVALTPAEIPVRV